MEEIEIDLDTDVVTQFSSHVGIRQGLKRIQQSMLTELQPKIHIGNSNYELAAVFYLKTKGAGTVVVEYDNPALHWQSSKKSALDQIRDEFFPGEGKI